ncbi:MAG: VOC family protein [Terriglobales bacterium]
MMPRDLTRRDALKLGGMALSAAVCSRNSIGADMALTDATDAFDHILVGSPNLEAAIDWFEKKTGVRPVVGGRHPGRGTRNALASLGKPHYLELLAPDPEQPNVDTPRLRVFRSLSLPAPYTWAAAMHDMEATRRAAEKARLKFEGPTPGSRKRPDGRLLEWSFLTLADDLNGLLPFFIEWGAQSLHPSEDSPQGCTLKALQLISPDAKKVEAALRIFGIRADVRHGAAPKLTVSLSTPRGVLEL